MKTLKPTTPGTRGTRTVTYRGVLSASTPHKSLTKGRKRHVGRNNQGKVTVRHKGAGHKRLYRDIDFSYDKMNVPATVETIEYDPNRTGFIALICYADGERRYVLAPKGVKVGDTLVTGEDAAIAPGNRVQLDRVPVGTTVYNVELQPGGGAKLGRSAGISIEVTAHDDEYTYLKLASSEIRKVPNKSWACIGEVSNDEHKLRNLGKAGRSRWLGIRPTVRGSAMNPVDHPYGGGEGRQGRGMRREKTKWGKEAGKGHKTRRPKKYSNVFIVSRRKVGKRK